MSVQTVHHPDDRDRKEAIPKMSTAGAFALTVADVAFFAPPPKRPDGDDRPGRSASSLLRSIRRELALVFSHHAHTPMPRISARHPH